MKPDVIVLAKAPLPGRCKTRLCPPLTPEEAAFLAREALVDTLEAARSARNAGRVVLVLEGRPGAWLPEGVEVVGQRGVGLDERIAAAFEDVRSPALLIGMDTPQVTGGMLDDALATLAEKDVDAVLGLARDGGWWAAGLTHPDPGAFLGVPMSTAHTGAAQAQRLRSMRLRLAWLPALRDVDTMADAYAVARAAPESRFANAVAALGPAQLAG